MATSRHSLTAQVVLPERFFGHLLAVDKPVHLNQHGQSRCYEGWAVNPRTIPDHLIYFVAESTLHARIGNRRLRLDPGGMCWVMPGVLHEFWLDPALPRPRIYHFKVAVRGARGNGPRLSQDVVVCNEASQLRPYCDDVSREAASTRPLAQVRLRAALASLLSGMLLQASSGRLGPSLDVRQRAAIVALLEHHPRRRPSSAQMAKVVGLQVDYFTRVFRRTYGVAPRTWIVRERMQSAAARLRDTDVSIEAIATELGYGTIFLFSRQFKQVFGRSPRAYRREL